MSRKSMLFDYSVWSSLTDKEKVFIKEKGKTNLIESLKLCAPIKKEGGGTHNKKRSDIIHSQIKSLVNPPSSLEDSLGWIAYTEEELLGISISCDKTDEYNKESVNSTCKEFLEGRKGYIVLGVEIKSIREIKVKKGKSKGKYMAYLSVYDGTCGLDSVTVFPEVYEKNSSVLKEGNIVGLVGIRDKKSDSFIVNGAWILNNQ